MQFLGLWHVALAGVDNGDTYLLKIKETILYMEWEFSLHLTCWGTWFVCTLNERIDVWITHFAAVDIGFPTYYNPLFFVHQ